MRPILLLLALCLPLGAQQLQITVRKTATNIVEFVVAEADAVILAKPRANASKEALDTVARRHGLRDRTKVKKLKWKQFEVPRGHSKQEIMRLLRESGLFEAVQENRTYRTQETVPNDPFFSQLWGLTNISAPKAWDLTREAPNVIVAVVDTGIDFTHPDLVGNLWTGINGEHGYSVYQGEVTAGGADDHGHGTHVSGTIAGVGNNGVGVAGIAWRAKIMSIKVLTGGSGSSQDIALGVEKLIELKESGLPIVASNHSYGGIGEDPIMQDAFALLEQADIFAAIAAGNNNTDNDSLPFVPAIFPFNNIVATVASDIGNNRANFSNWGLVKTDIAAPGVGILSSTRSNTYSSWSGTSMASPHVCGVALLVRARNPALSARAVRDLILDPASYDSFPQLSNNNTSARLNVDKTIRNSRLFESPFRLNNHPFISSVSPYTVVNGSAVIEFSVTDPDNDPLRSSVVSSGFFANDYTGFFKALTAKNGFNFRPGVNNVTISSDPFAYQLGSSLMAEASDNRGGGVSKPTGFEVAKSKTVRRPIVIKTWIAQTNDANGSISWVFDVADEVKTDYSYIFSWTKGWGTGSWFGFQPSPNAFTATIPQAVGKFSLRVFCMDKYFNWVNSEPLVFPTGSPTFPHCRAVVNTVEGNAPFDVVFDLRPSSGPISHWLLGDFFVGGVNQVGPVITNTFSEPLVKFTRPIVLSTATIESDGIILPIFSSRFADLALTNQPPTEPPAVTNLVAVTNLFLTTSGPGTAVTVTLHWTDSSTNEDRYVMEASYKATKGYQSPWMTVGTLAANSTFFVHVPDERKATWSYRVKACGGQICAPNSNLASVRIR